MTKETRYGSGVKKSEICDAVKEAESCHTAVAREVSRVPAGRVIDFRARASELRVQGAEKGSVSSFEATKALAFGMMYLNGEGVERDPSKAAQFLATAAKGGSSKARRGLCVWTVTKWRGRLPG